MTDSHTIGPTLGPGGRPGHVVAAIDLGGTKCHGAVATPEGTALFEDHRSTSPGAAWETLMACWGALRSSAATGGFTVCALSVAVPGVVDTETGQVRNAPNLGWDAFDLGRLMAREVGCPVVVRNDAELAAIGELRRGAARGVDDFVIISIGTGIGAAVVIDGRMVPGAHNAAGEIGALVLDRQALDESRIGTTGWLENLISGAGVANAARRRVHQADPGSVLAHADVITTEAVFRAATAGDQLAGGLMDGFFDYLTMTLIAVVGTVDPALVVLDGGVGRALAGSLGRLEYRLAGHLSAVPQLELSTLRPTAAIVGGIELAWEAAGSRGHR